MSHNENKKSFFPEFSENSKQDWKEAAGNYGSSQLAQSLIWDTPAGFSVDAFYTKEELTPNAYLTDFQVNAGGGLKQPKRWEYREVVVVKPGGLQEANKAAIAKLASGADGIIFDLGLLPIDALQPALLLQDINFYGNSISCKTSESRGVLEKWVDFLKKSTTAGSKIYGTCYFDPIAHWSQTGLDFKDGLEELLQCLRNCDGLPGYHCFSVRGDHFHDAGGHWVQELAFTLSAAVAYLDRLTEAGFGIHEIIEKMSFSVAVGSSYFMEITKFRALRILFAKIVAAYGVKDFSPSRVQVHATSASITKTAKEPYTNMVRNTAEAMAAVLGGCNALTLLPFDQAYKNPGDFAQRISRNVSLLLQEEAHFDKTADPVAGAYYITHLTGQLIENAWQLFLKVEAKGGYTEAFKAGFIQNEIQQSAREKLMSFRKGKLVQVGVNKYQSGETYPELGDLKSLNEEKTEQTGFPLLAPLQLEDELNT